jgi:hypothetical protein
MNQNKPASHVVLLLSELAFLTFSAALLQAEDVIVTSCIDDQSNDCPPSCPYGADTMGLHSSASSAVPIGAGRSKTVFVSGTNAAWAVTPSLGTGTGVYRVYVSLGTTYNCPTDLMVKLVATTDCTLADLSYVGKAQIYTTAFQQGASYNVWTPVAIITNSSTTPKITFSYASGGSNRWYMDEVRFENIASAVANPARITAIFYGSSLTITGAGPASRPFALVSSTDASRPLSQWTREQTNTAATGSFTFTVTRGTASARFFRVITQ